MLQFANPFWLCSMLRPYPAGPTKKSVRQRARRPLRAMPRLQLNRKEEQGPAATRRAPSRNRRRKGLELGKQPRLKTGREQMARELAHVRAT